MNTKRYLKETYCGENTPLKWYDKDGERYLEFEGLDTGPWGPNERLQIRCMLHKAFVAGCRQTDMMGLLGEDDTQ